MALTLIATTLLTILLIKPLLSYLYDPKSLRQYPPLNPLSGLTSLATIWDRLDPFRTRTLYTHHKTHPIVRIAPIALSFADTRAIKDIYGHGTPCRKDDMYELITGEYAHVLNVIDRDDHARKRRMVSHAFATRNLEQWEFKIKDKVERLVRQMDSVEGENGVVDFRWWANLFTVDAIVDMTLSERTNLLESGIDTVVMQNGDAEYRYIDSLHSGSRFASLFVGASGWFHLLSAAAVWFSPSLRLYSKKSQGYSRIVSDLVEKRLQKHQSGVGLGDFISCLLTDKSGTERRLDRGEIEAEVNVLLDAGSDTTAIALTHALYYLIKNPRSLAKLREELDDALSGHAIASYAQVKNLPYLKACLDESLPLSPPLSRGPERRTPPGGMQIMGHHIAGDVAVSVPTYVAHRDPTIFPHPEAYRPERWLEEDGEKARQRRDAFVPFSTGARGCIGRKISMMEQQMLIASVVHRYEFSLPSEEWELNWEEAFLLWPSQMPLKIRRRSS